MIELYAATNDLSRNKPKNGLKVPCELVITSVLALSMYETSRWYTLISMRVSVAFFCLLFFTVPGFGQSAAPSPDDYSGMYSFLRDGEFVQITIDDSGKVSGFISRYGDTEADKNTFVEQFLESGKLDANRLSFTTKSLDGTSFKFVGSIERGAGKTADDEGYFVIRGTLTRLRMDAAKKITAESQQVEFRSFPRDAGQ
ncbi:MAG TPA: hypothetical protein VJ731_07195 [Terriglobales bacterium]|nr:hypothetical protein [Terriglobales bacterium]